MQDLFGMVCVILLVTVIFLMGKTAANSSIIDECKRQNNVYACDVIAVPVKPEGK